MSLAALWTPPNTEELLRVFSFSNMAEHTKAAEAVFKKYGTNLQLYPLDPIPPSERRGAWLYQHQAMHNDLDDTLGVAGVDLTSVVWEDPEQVLVWIELHAPLHMQYAQILGTT